MTNNDKLEIVLILVVNLTLGANFHLAYAQQQIQVHKIEDIFFDTDGTGSMEFAGYNYTHLPQRSIALGHDWRVDFTHSLTIEAGYWWEELSYPYPCSVGARYGIVFYPNNTRLDPETLPLDTVIKQIIGIPPGLVLPDVLKMSDNTTMRTGAIGHVLSLEEEAQMNEKCDVSSSR